MLRVTIGSHPASYDGTDGWRCNDGLAQRHLQACTDDESAKAEGAPISEEQALALAVREYGDLVTLDEPDTLDGHHDDLADAAPAGGPTTELTELELPPPDTQRNTRLLAFLGSR